MNDFDRHRAEIQDARARMGRDHEAMKQEMARSHQRFENVIFGACLVVTGVLLFACWCVYHVLKSKGLVP